MNQLEIQYRSIDDLIPYAKNSRTHSADQVNQIAASIKEFGFTNPILLDKEGGIIAGHGRVQAARKLKLTEVPTITLGNLTDAQRRAYVIADNKLALNAGWDEEMLAIEIEQLMGEDYNLDLLGFSKEELANIMGTPIVEGLTDEDAVPEIPDEPVTVLSDIWVLGNHRLMCGDSTNIDAVDKLMQKDKASLVVTDPPWNVAYGTNLANNAQGYKKREILNDNFETDEQWDAFLTGVMSCIVSVTLPGCPIYCVMGASEWPAIDKALRNAGFHWSSTIIWAKDTLVLSRKDYHTQYEPIWYGWKSDGARIWTVKDRKQSDLWECKRPKRSELHPTTKPVELIERAVLNSSNENVFVFEPFGGSGSTLIACEKTTRFNRSMELDPKYCDVIVKRWQEFTGKQAVLDNDGRTFDDISSERKVAIIPTPIIESKE
jgi:DNA modification methylase